MTIALDGYEFLDDKWKGFEEIHLCIAPDKIRTLVCDIPGVSNIHAPEELVKRAIKKSGKTLADATRGDIVDAIVECYGA